MLFRPTIQALRCMGCPALQSLPVHPVAVLEVSRGGSARALNRSARRTGIEGYLVFAPFKGTLLLPWSSWGHPCLDNSKYPIDSNDLGLGLVLLALDTQTRCHLPPDIPGIRICIT